MFFEMSHTYTPPFSTNIPSPIRRLDVFIADNRVESDCRASGDVFANVGELKWDRDNMAGNWVDRDFTVDDVSAVSGHPRYVGGRSVVMAHDGYPVACCQIKPMASDERCLYPGKIDRNGDCSCPRTALHRRKN